MNDEIKGLAALVANEPERDAYGNLLSEIRCELGDISPYHVKASISFDKDSMEKVEREAYMEELGKRMKEANDLFSFSLSQALFDINEEALLNYKPPTKWEIFKYKAMRPYYFVRCRVVGIWNVLLHGECEQCERDDYYY